MNRCGTVIADARCGAPAAYRAVIADCANCRDAGFVGCFGHSVCIRDAAPLRAGVFHFAQGGPAVLTHIHAPTTALEMAHAHV